MESFGRDVKTAEYTLYLHEAFYPDNFKFGLAMHDVGPGQTVNQAITDNYERFVRAGDFPHPIDWNLPAKTLDVAVISNANHENMTVGIWLTLKKAELFSDRQTFFKTLENKLQIEVAPIVPEKLQNSGMKP